MKFQTNSLFCFYPGFINTATLGLDQYTINDQAYSTPEYLLVFVSALLTFHLVNVIPSKDNPPTPGLIGLGPSSLSQVRSLVKSSAGDPPLDRIFRQNTSTPNFISVYLTRAGDPSEAQTGQLTIGTVVPEYSDITKQTKLPALTDQFGVQHWETLLDANGIIGPDGKNLNTKTTISNPSAGTADQLHVVFDTGYTFPQVPQSVADAIYGRVPDAEFVTQTSSPGYWRVPCDYELNISFSLGGATFPIAPLDLTTPEGGTSKSCIGTFQQISPQVANHKAFGAFDMILGMAFLRNAYLLIDFGDFVDGSSSSTADPYIQLLPITTLADGHGDFVRERLSGVDTTGSQAALLSEADAKHSPNVSNSADPDGLRTAYSNGANGDDSDEPWYRRTWFIIAAAAGGGLILLGILGLAARRCATRRSRVRNESAFVPTLAGARAYAPLRDPVVGASSGPGGPPPQYMREYRSSVDAGYSYGAGGGAGYAEPRYQYGGRDV